MPRSLNSWFGKKVLFSATSSSPSRQITRLPWPMRSLPVRVFQTGATRPPSLPWFVVEGLRGLGARNALSTSHSLIRSCASIQGKAAETRGRPSVEAAERRGRGHARRSRRDIGESPAPRKLAGSGCQLGRHRLCPRGELTASRELPCLRGRRRALEDRLAKALGTKVRVADRKGKGHLQISFTSYDELDRLLDVIM